MNPILGQLYYLYCKLKIVMNGTTQKGRNIAELFSQLMDQNPNIPDVKAMVREYTDRTQILVYQALIGTQQQYLQTYGLSYHEEQHFNYINQMLHERTILFLDKIEENKVEVNSTLPPPPPPPPQVPAQIVSEVDSILNNIDLPLSLFKRNDSYWSPDNSKTLQVKQYIKKLHEQDRKWKEQLKKKRQQILNQKNQIYHKNNEESVKQQQKMKEEEKSKIIKKIELIKSQSQSRKKTIEQSLEFMKKQGRPLFKKMQEDFMNKVELPTLEEKKRKLSQIRSLRRSVDMIQIQQHKEKCEKLKEQHEPVKIHNEAVKVSFKGSFHQSLQKSRISEIENQSRLKTLFDRKSEYSKIVKQKYMPAVDQDKAAQIAQRIQMMNKKFTRAKRKNIRLQDDEDEDQQEQEPEEQPQHEEEEQQDDEEDEDGEKPPKDDQYEPSQSERYKMGLKFLQEARKRRKKIGTARNQSQALVDDSERNKTFSAKQTKQSQVISSEFQTISPSLITNQNGGKIRYRNYLHEMSKTNKTIDHIDTSRIKKQFTHDMKLKEPLKIQEVENKIRSVEEKARYQEALLKYGRKKKSESLEKKQELDNVILDTIKARLALMKN